MKTLFLLGFCLSLALPIPAPFSGSSSSALASAQEPAPPLPTREEAAQTIMEMAQEAVAQGFAGQILAVRGGEILVHEPFGEAGPGIPMDRETVFAIGSVTKQFTKAAILRLEEQGSLSTSDPVSRFIDGLPEDKQAITLDQLLAMEAGLGEYHDDSGDHQPMTKEEALGRIGAQELRFPPGTDRAYSNSGYTLLAAVVEEASGRSYEEFVRDELMGPGLMRTAGFHGEGMWPDHLVARGRGMRSHGEVNAPHRWPLVTWALKGGGGMVASAFDLFSWIRAARAGEVLGPEATAKLYPPDRTDAVYAGGDDFGFQTGIIELAGGWDLVIINTNTGYRSLPLAARVAGAMVGEQLPQSIRDLAGEDEGDGAEQGGQAGGLVREVDGGPGGQVPDSPRGLMGRIFTQALEDGSTEALRSLVQDHFSPEMRDAFPMEEHLEQLGQLSAVAREAAEIRLSPAGPFTVELHYIAGSGSWTVVVVDVQESPPHQVIGVSVEER